jgi:hypothetical protein
MQNNIDTKTLNFIGASAQQVHEQLIKLLAPEIDKKSWFEFVRLAAHHLPALNSKGRPSKAEISNSFIGELGFSSWKSYVETAPKAGGLGWTETTWKRWREAYKLAENNLWMLGNFTPDEIRVVARNYGHEIPNDLTSYKALEVQKNADRKLKITAQKEETTKQLAQLPILHLKIEDLQERLKSAENARDLLNQRIGLLEAENANLRGFNSFFGHIKQAFYSLI